MTRPIILILMAAAAILPAADGGKGSHHELGAVLGRQAVDAGHVLEVRALPGSGLVLIRWGDLDNTIAKGAKGTRFGWDGSASVSSGSVSFVRTVRFEDGAKTEKAEKAGKHPDQITADGYGGQVTWHARTSGAWDGVVVRAPSGSQLSVQAGPAALAVAVP